VLTDVTFKVLPAAETEVTLAIRGMLDDAATAAHGAGAWLERRSVERGAPARTGLPRASPTVTSAAMPRRCCASRGSDRRSPTASLH